MFKASAAKVLHFHSKSIHLVLWFFESLCTCTCDIMCIVCGCKMATIRTKLSDMKRRLSKQERLSNKAVAKRVISKLYIFLSQFLLINRLEENQIFSNFSFIICKENSTGHFGAFSTDKLTQVATKRNHTKKKNLI